jgi:branched-chain amino acid transport system substrate-binding protein
MTMRRWLGIAVLALAVAGGCGDDGSSPSASESRPSAASERVRVGAVLSLTGAAAPYAASQQRGLDLAVADVAAAGGPTLDVVVMDDESDPDAGVAAFEDLIDDDAVLAIIGPTLTNTAIATDPVAQEAGVPVLAISNTVGDITAIGDHIFRASLTEAQVIPEVVARARSEYALTDVAVLRGEGDTFTMESYQVFADALAANGIDVLATETFQLGDRQFGPQLERILPLAPDALVVSALAGEGAAILTEARAAGFTGPVLGGNGFNAPTVIETAGPAAEGLVVGAAWNRYSNDPTSRAFVESYEATYGALPDQFAAQAYAGVQIVAAAVSAAGDESRAAVRDALSEVRDLATPLGSFSFTAGREADAPAAVTVVRDGEFRPQD